MFLFSKVDSSNKVVKRGYIYDKTDTGVVKVNIRKRSVKYFILTKSYHLFPFNYNILNL